MAQVSRTNIGRRDEFWRSRTDLTMWFLQDAERSLRAAASTDGRLGPMHGDAVAKLRELHDEAEAEIAVWRENLKRKRST